MARPRLRTREVAWSWESRTTGRGDAETTLPRTRSEHAPPCLRELAARAPGAGRYVGARGPAPRRCPQPFLLRPCPPLGLSGLSFGPLAARFLTGKSRFGLPAPPERLLAVGCLQAPILLAQVFLQSSGDLGTPGTGPPVLLLGAGLVTFPLRSLSLPHFTPSGLVIIRSSQLCFLCVICSVGFYSNHLPSPSFSPESKSVSLRETSFSPLKCKITALLLFRKQV